jgi:hypothetical protein
MRGRNQVFAAVGHQTERAITQRKPRVIGRNDNVSSVEQTQSAAASTAAHRSDHWHIDAG